MNQIFVSIWWLSTSTALVRMYFADSFLLIVPFPSPHPVLPLTETLLNIKCNVYITISVHPPHVCTHELSKTSYNDRDDLSEILDDDGILKLMKYTLNDEDYVQVWRSCHGGTDPALGLLFHLARTVRTTLEELWAVCSSCGFNDVSEIIQSECMRSPSVASQQLDKQELSLLTKIAEKISENPNSRRKGPPWKTIASSMGLSIHTIEKLDAPSAQSRNSESLTMTFISFMTGKFPFTKVAAIAQGLVAIGRNDVLQEKMFEKCRKEGCISIQ